MNTSEIEPGKDKFTETIKCRVDPALKKRFNAKAKSMKHNESSLLRAVVEGFISDKSKAA